MAKWMRLFVAVLVITSGLVLASCGRSRSYNNAATSQAQGMGGAYGDTMPRHHSLLKGAAVGAVAGHMMGHHAVAGAVVGAIVQHERNKHRR